MTGDTVRLDLGLPLSDEQVETLRDSLNPDRAAGDSDWRDGATYAYTLTHDTDVLGVQIDAGVYLRHVLGGHAWAWPVLGGDVTAYIEQTESRYLAETGQ
jgi:hypothetical protein